MTEADFKTIETKLKVELPRAYKQLQLKYPKRLNRYQSKAWPRDQLDMYWLFFLAKHVVDYTTSHRESMGVYLPGGTVGKWPDQYLVIGRDGPDGGDFYCLDLSRDDDIVYRFDHEQGIFIEHAESLRAYAAWVYEYLR